MSYFENPEPNHGLFRLPDNSQNKSQKENWPSAPTGARREKMNDLPYDQVPYQEITDAFTRVAEFGVKKYGPWNWSLGIPRIQLLGSLLRHTFAYIRGEDRDKETGLLHTDHILWNAVAIVHSVHWGLEDGRRKEPPREYKERNVPVHDAHPKMGK